MTLYLESITQGRIDYSKLMMVDDDGRRFFLCVFSTNDMAQERLNGFPDPTLALNFTEDDQPPSPTA